MGEGSVQAQRMRRFVRLRPWIVLGRTGRTVIGIQSLTPTAVRLNYVSKRCPAPSTPSHPFLHTALHIFIMDHFYGRPMIPIYTYNPDPREPRTIYVSPDFFLYRSDPPEFFNAYAAHLRADWERALVSCIYREKQTRYDVWQHSRNAIDLNRKGLMSGFLGLPIPRESAGGWRLTREERGKTARRRWLKLREAGRGEGSGACF